jgi:tryptophan synthase alpha chain
MSAIDDLFANLKATGQTAFMPFITAGDPNLKATADLLRALDQVGCHLIELGIPYSDPIADGPVIQASYTRALNAGTQLDQIFEMVSSVSKELTTPIVSMVSYAIIFRVGLAKYIARAKAAGISGAIVPDMPVDESGVFASMCRDEDFSLIQLITPTTPQERAIQIAKQTTGFIYYVSITGITGERTELPPELVENLAWLRTQTELPICVGFGISRPDQVEMLTPVADGLIVGSAIVRRIADAQEDAELGLSSVSEFAMEMLEAIRN